MYLRTNVPFQYTISGNREQVFLLYYKDFFEQICSDVQFISPPEEVGEFLLHLLKSSLNMPGSKLEIFHSRFNGEAPLLGSIAVVANEIFSHQLKLLP